MSWWEVGPVRSVLGELRNRYNGYVDTNLVVAIVTSICTAGSTSGVAITALMLSNKRLDRVEASLDKLDSSVNHRFQRMDDRFQHMEERIAARFDSVDARLDLLTGVTHELDKRLSIIEDRVSRNS